MRVEKQFELSKFSTIQRKTIALQIFGQKGLPSEEHNFQLAHVSANRKSFFIHTPNDLVLPVALNKLRIGQEVELRVITQGEKVYSYLLEILNRSISWWTGQPGFETLLVAMKLKPITPMPIPTAIKSTIFSTPRRAIAAALEHERQFVVIHGPRGSGKTLIAAEIMNKVIFLNFGITKNRRVTDRGVAD